MQKDQDIVNLDDFERLAAEKLTQNAFDYYVSGANKQITLIDNKTAFSKIKFNPRICAKVQTIDLQTTVLGQKVDLPFGIAPTAMHKLCHELGELNAARVSSRKKIIYTMSTLSTTSMEDIANNSERSFRWFQLYITRNRDISLKLIKNAEKNGFTAIVLTVDAPILGKREKDERKKFRLPKQYSLELLKFYGDFDVSNDQGSGLFKVFSDQIDSSLGWEDVIWLTKQTNLPIVLKGIQCREDAELASDLGVHVWVSNHGGRQLDTVRSTIEMLPEIVEGIVKKGNKVEVYVDGGIRYGSDVIKCLALGARYVFLGRPVLFSNTYDGEKGINLMLEILEKDMRIDMTLLGVEKISQINHKCIITNHMTSRL